MKMVIRVCTAIVALVICSSCGGGSPFIPDVGPFNGEFVADGVVVGSFTLTTTGGLLGGTGTITHNNQPVNISISATINGQQIAGTMSNASLGAGFFSGQFTGTNDLSGTFNYQDIGKISISAGTWVASTPPGSS